MNASNLIAIMMAIIRYPRAHYFESVCALSFLSGRGLPERRELPPSKTEINYVFHPHTVTDGNTWGTCPPLPPPPFLTYPLPPFTNVCPLLFHSQRTLFRRRYIERGERTCGCAPVVWRSRSQTTLWKRGSKLCIRCGRECWPPVPFAERCGGATVAFSRRWRRTKARGEGRARPTWRMPGEVRTKAVLSLFVSLSDTIYRTFFIAVYTSTFRYDIFRSIHRIFRYDIQDHLAALPT